MYCFWFPHLSPEPDSCFLPFFILIWGLLNLRNDKWYRFLWAWVILTPVLLASFARVMFG